MWCHLESASDLHAVSEQNIGGTMSSECVFHNAIFIPVFPYRLGSRFSVVPTSSANPMDQDHDSGPLVPTGGMVL